MLAADKLQLQSALKQQATALKEKEFNLHHSNLMTVGTQAAVLAGLDITMFIEFQPAPDSDWPVPYQLVARVLKLCYYTVIVSAFSANLLVVAHTTALSVLGAGLALRGPDGSMMTATDGLYEERRSVFNVFGIGLALTVGSVLISVWLILRCEAAFVCWLITLWTCRKMWENYKRVRERFGFDESETVDFSDIMDGPAAIIAIPHKISRMTKRVLGVQSTSSSSHGQYSPGNRSPQHKNAGKNTMHNMNGSGTANHKLLSRHSDLEVGRMSNNKLMPIDGYDENSSSSQDDGMSNPGYFQSLIRRDNAIRRSARQTIDSQETV
jgi:hypothetical protein